MCRRIQPINLMSATSWVRRSHTGVSVVSMRCLYAATKKLSAAHNIDANIAVKHSLRFKLERSARGLSEPLLGEHTV